MNWLLLRRGDGRVQLAWGLHLMGLVPLVLWLEWVGMPVWAYLLAVYLGTALLKIRTFLEHRAHEAFRARTVIIEDRGPLSYLFLNNNFHVVHHMHPAVPWYELPATLCQPARALPAPQRGLRLSQLWPDHPAISVARERPGAASDLASAAGRRGAGSALAPPRGRLWRRIATEVIRARLFLLAFVIRFG